jgi:hypothetical protein
MNFISAGKKKYKSNNNTDINKSNNVDTIVYVIVGLTVLSLSGFLIY